MKKIGTYDWTSGITDAIRTVIPTVYVNGVDVYKEDDGSVRIFPHKISFEEALNSTMTFLEDNKAGSFAKNIYYEWADKYKKTICVINRKGDKISVGVARFNPTDGRCSISIGQALAYSRASGKKLPTELTDYLNIKR